MTFFEKLCLKDLRLSGKVVLFFFVGLACTLFLIHGAIVLGFQYPLDYGEGPLLNHALRITQGAPLYPNDFDSPPYLTTNYPPVYVLLNAFLILIFGPHLVLGRLISLLSTIGSAIFIGLIVHHFYRKRGILPGIFTAGTFLIIPYILHWSAYYRIDMLALVFSLAGLYILIKHPEDSRFIIWSAILFLLSAYTRQSFGLAGPLAGIIWVWYNNRKQAYKLFLIYSIGGLAIFGLLNWLTGGGFFFHIIIANVNPFNWETVWHYANEIRNLMPLTLAALGLYLILGWRYTKTYTFLTPYLLTGILAAITIGKVGSNINYLIEVSAGASILLGVMLGWLSEAFPVTVEQRPDMVFPEDEIPDPEKIDPLVKQKLWLNLAIFLGVTVLMIAQISGLIHRSLRSPIPAHRDRIKQGYDYVFLEENIKNAFEVGDVLADEFMAILPKNQIPLYIQPFEMTQLSNANVWDQTPLIESINKHEFSLIMIHHFPHYPVYLERWTPAMLEAIYDNYVATNIKADSLMFTPKDPDVGNYPIERNCPQKPWQIPTEAHMGLFWYNGQLLMMGDGHQGEIPVYAVADGWLYQFADWQTAVAIQHIDPFEPNRMIWSFYGDLAPAFDAENAFIESQFKSADGIPVKAGDLIGFQGGWLGSNQQTWTHARFSLVPADEDGSFPEVLIPIDDFFGDLPSYRELTRLGYDVPVSLSLYTGLPESDIFGNLAFLPYCCESGVE